MLNHLKSKLYGLLLMLLCGIGPSHAQVAIPSNWCTHIGAQRLFGDIDGDGVEDALCHDRNTGHKWVALNRGGRLYHSWENPSRGWCIHTGATLYLADVNGDRRADLVCRDPGRIWIDYYEGDYYTGHRPGDTLDTHWCTHAGTLFLGLIDQNGDGRADLVCKDYRSGYFWVDHADASGKFSDTDVERFSPDLLITAVDPVADGQSVTVLNNSPVSGLATQVDCRGDGREMFFRLPSPVTVGAFRTVRITNLLAPTATNVICRVTGTDLDRRPELYVSNNSGS